MSRRLHARDRGSVLMLMPAAVLIVLLLGAIAVDSAVVYLHQRQAYNVAFDAANDAAGAGIDLHTARSAGEFTYSPARVYDIARLAVEAAGTEDIVFVDARTAGDEVVVTVDVTVRHLFVQAFGDAARDTLRITARARGEIRDP